MISNSVIDQCYSRVHIHENFYLRSVGGLLGASSNSLISDSFYFGYITSKKNLYNLRVGGLIGSVVESVIENCYVAGNSLFLNVSSLIGSINGTTMRNSFWDIDTTGMTNLYSDFGTHNYIINNLGLSTLEMNQKSTFIESDWNFENVWMLESYVNASYPYLLAMRIEPNVSESDLIDTPVMTALHGNFPNPFNPITSIRYRISENKYRCF